MRDFRRYDIWQRSFKVVLLIYRLTNRFPVAEVYGLTSQLRKSSNSVAANIAEGCGRGSEADFARFLRISVGSASETQSHIMIAAGLGYLDKETADEVLDEISQIRQMIGGLIRSLGRKTAARKGSRKRSC